MQIIKGTVNWGIIGCGDVCEVKSGPAFNKVPNSKLVAVMRRNYDKAKDYAERHNVARFYNNAADLIADNEVNAVYIATPPASHEMYVEMALKANKPVYVEKPVALNTSSVLRMIEMEKKYNGKVSVAHYRRALPFFNQIKQLLTDNVIGKVKIIFLKTLQPVTNKIITQTEDNWRINPAISGGGLFHDLSPHQLDILYWLFGKPQNIHIVAINQGRHYNAPDLTMVQLKFDNDIYFNGTWNFNVAETAAEESCDIIGDKGSIKFSFFGGCMVELNTDKGKEIFEKPHPENIQYPHIANVVQYFRGAAANPCTLQDALVTMEILDKAK